MKYFQTFFSLSETLINEAKARYDKEHFNESDEDKGMLYLLLKKDKRFATVMAFDMIFGGIDTVRTNLSVYEVI